MITDTGFERPILDQRVPALGTLTRFDQLPLDLLEPALRRGYCGQEGHDEQAVGGGGGDRLRNERHVKITNVGED